MKFNVLDVVVLDTDLTAEGLRKGDLGAVVEVYGSNSLEVEFVTGTGRTVALVTLDHTEVRAIDDSDLVAVRPLTTPSD